MTATGDLLRVGQTMQAAALLGQNYKLTKKKKVGVKDFLETGTTNILGTELIKAQAQLTAGL